MLRACGEALSSEKIPPTSQAGRIGGDEFLMLLPNTGKMEAESVMEEIRAYLDSIEGYPYKIVMSLGTAVKTHEDDDIMAVMEEADMAMYKNKKLLKGGAEIRNTETILV
jgi:diguanylate cyclase (GGDEF)-like protein